MIEPRFVNTILKLFLKLKRIKLFFIFLLAMIFNLSLYGQLEEISQIVPSHIVQMEKINNQFILIGRSEIYPHNYNPDGMAVLLDKSTMEMEVSFRFQNKNGNLTKWTKGEISHLSNSEKSIIYIRDEICQKSIMFYYKVISQVGFPEILSSGVFLPDLEIYPKGKPLRRHQILDLPKPNIITRSEWGARSPTHGYSTHPYYTKLTLHHAAGFSAEGIDEGKEQLRAIQDLHQFVRGWSDIGYHFIIDKAGNIYQGRPETVIGAHVLGNNTGNIGVCVLGCYHPPELYCGDWLSDETTSALVALYAWISNEYNYNPNILLGHRDYPNNDTSCPGNNVHQNLPWFRNEIERYLNLGGPPLEFSISSSYPNPFNNKTKSDYRVPLKNHISIIIYDLLGREVKTLIDQVQSKGDYEVAWDGVSNLGEAMSTGVYFLQFKSDHFSKNNKIVLIK